MRKRRFKIKFWRKSLFFLLCFTTIPIANVSAATDVPVAKSQYLVVPGGDTIGLHMDTGVYIAGSIKLRLGMVKCLPGEKVKFVKEIR